MGVGDKIKDAFRFEEDKQADDGDAPQGPGTKDSSLFVQHGDPSMGGKHNRAADSAETGPVPSNQTAAGVVQNGDPSMGGKATRAEGIN